MPSLPIIAALFIGVPLLEIYLFIKVGGVIGAVPTVIMVVVTAVVGAYLLRSQGLQTFARFQGELVSGQMPAQTMMEGALLLVGGVTLLTPGFFTDALGFLALIPWTRRAIVAYLRKRWADRVTVHSNFGPGPGPGSGPGPHRPSQGEKPPIEGDYQEK